MSAKCPNKNSPEWKELVKVLGNINAYKVFIHNNDEVPDMQGVDKYIDLYIQTKQRTMPEGSHNYTKVNAEQAKLIKSLDAPGITVRTPKGVKNSKPFWTYEVARKSNQYFSLSPEVKFDLKLVQGLEKIQRNKFKSQALQGWINDLQKQGVPKEQVELFKQSAKEGMTKDDIITDILANFSFTVEINTATKRARTDDNIFDIDSLRIDRYGNKFKVYDEANFDEDLGTFDSREDAQKFINSKIQTTNTPTQHYSNLTVLGGTNYTENEISTPSILAFLKGHAQFSTDNGIGWFRSDDKVDNTKIELIPNEIKKKELIDLWGNNPKYKEILSSNINVYSDKRIGESDFSGGVLHNLDTDEMYYLHPDDMEPLLDSKANKEDIIPKQSGGTKTKTRRILEVQSDLFQKRRNTSQLASSGYYKKGDIVETDKGVFEVLGSQMDKNNEPELRLKNLNTGQIGKVNKEKFDAKLLGKNTENQFLQLLNKNNNWVTFFVKSIIQDSAKKGYEKILFPKGDTAAKIEGHQTLEEFKKQKEARIKQLEDNKKYNVNGFIEDIDFDDMGRHKVYKIPVEEIDREIKQLKQELADVESGQTQLSSIANFYEKTITNILKKQGYNPVTVTDEHGNTWNEVKIQSDNLSKIYLQQPQESKSKINKALESKLFTFLDSNNINVKNIKELQGRLGIDALGLADLAKRAIYLADNRNEDTLPEEAAHFVIEALEDDIIVRNALKLVDQSSTYKKNYSRYMEVYGDETMVRKEVLGKLLAQAIVNQNEETQTEQEESIWKRLKTILKAIANKFKKIYTGEQIDNIIKQSLSPIARQVLTNDIEIKSNLKGKLYQLNEQSKQINSLKKELTAAVQARITNIVVAEKHRKEEVTKDKLSELERIENLLIDNKTTDAMLNFVNIIYSDAAATVKRLGSLDNSALPLSDQADILRRAYQMNSGYKDLIKKINKELAFGRMEDIKEVRNLTSLLSSHLDTIEETYKDESKRIFGEALKDFITQNNEIKEDDIIGLLEVADRDLNFGRRWLDAMAESGDDILGATDLMVKNFFEKTQMQVQQLTYDLIEAENKLKESGVKDTSFMLERYANGELTGYFISDYHMGDFTKSRKDYAIKVEKALNISNADLKQLRRGNPEVIEKYMKEAPKEIKELYANAFIANKKVKDKYFYEVFVENFNSYYSKQWQPWFKENTKTHPEAEKLMQEKKRSLVDRLVTAKEGSEEYKRQVGYAKDLYEEWLNHNRKEYANGDVYYTGELTVPADKFKRSLPQGAEREYYNVVMNLKKQLDKHLPETKLGLLAPQIRKDWLERFRKNPKQAIKETLKDFERREDDVEFGLADSEGNPVDFVPVFYRKQLSNMKDLSTDITATMTRYADMAINYKNMKSLVNILELGKDVLSQRKIKTGKTNALSRMFGIFNNQDTYEEKLGGNAYERYKDYIDMVIYGKNKADEGSVNVFGYKVDKAKAVDAFTRYTSINNLALNLYAGIANPIIGNWTIRQEAMAKEFFSNKDINYGTIQYTKDLPALMGSIGELRTSSKLRLFMEKVNAMDDLEGRLHDVNTSRNKFGRLFNESTLFAATHIGEHEMRGRTALALANTIKLKDKNGKEYNLYEAYEVTGKNKLKLREGLEFSEEELTSFRLKLKGINKRMHGIYNKIDKSAMQQYSLGRAALLFRKFIKPGFNRRWNRKEFNYELGTHTEGYYLTGGRFWINFFKEFKKYGFSYIRKYPGLNEQQKANVIRFNYEMLSLLGLMVLAAAAESGLDDDDDYLVTMIAYQLNRLQTEMSFFWNPTEAIKLVKSPAAGVDMLNTTLSLFTKSMDLGAIFTDDPFIKEYKSGPNAGDTYFWHSLKKTVPLVDTVEDWFDPDEKLKYFNR